MLQLLRGSVSSSCVTDACLGPQALRRLAALGVPLFLRTKRDGWAVNFAKLPELPRAATAIATLIECHTNPLVSSPRHVALPLNLIAFNH